MANDYNVTHAAKVGHLKQLLQDTKVRLTDTINLYHAQTTQSASLRRLTDQALRLFRLTSPANLSLTSLRQSLSEILCGVQRLIPAQLTLN